MSTEFNYISSSPASEVNFNRQNYGPLDCSMVFKNLTDLKYYIIGSKIRASELSANPATSSVWSNADNFWKNDATKYAYVGQIVTVVDNGVSAFKILDVPNALSDIPGISSGTPKFQNLIKQIDDLSEAQVSAINSVVDERATIVKYNDDAIDSLNIVGVLNKSKIPRSSDVVEIKIGNTVTSIDAQTFQDCRNLTNVIIGNSVTSIGDYAFYDCRGLTSATIPDSVTSIGYSAFSRCAGLTSVSLGDGLTYIGTNAFSSCSRLTSVRIPDSVTSIGNVAFEGCQALTSVTIGNSVTSIGNVAFEDCINLTSVTFRGKTIDVVRAMEYYPWGIPNSATYNTWNDASKEYVNDYAISRKSTTMTSPGVVTDYLISNNFGGVRMRFSSQNLDNYTAYAYNGVAVKRNNGTTVNYLFDTISSDGIVRRNELSGYLPSSISSDLSSAIQFVSSDTSSKIWIEDRINNLISGYSNLSAIKLTEDEYVALYPNYDPNTLFVVESDKLNAYDARVINVADGEEDSDAVNYGQLTSIESNLTSDISSISSVLTDEIRVVSSDTSSKIWIEDKISNLISGHSNLSVVKLSEDDYAALYSNYKPNTFYVVESDNLNAYNEKVINVADGEDDSDAVNVKQLISVRNEIDTKINEFAQKLWEPLSGYVNANPDTFEAVSEILRKIVSTISSVAVK